MISIDDYEKFLAIIQLHDYPRGSLEEQSLFEKASQIRKIFIVYINYVVAP